MKIGQIYNKKVLKWGLISIIVAWVCLPLPYYDFPYSDALVDQEGRLLAANVNIDQQWHFPLHKAEIPDDLKTAILVYEDEYFFYHMGVNVISLIKALISNIKHKKIVRGGSTLTMQLMRMKNKNIVRNIPNKIYEILAAIKYECLHSKEDIIHEWCTIAPFGSNTIGARAAALRYFGRPIDQLSWAEYALLAVMPNKPAKANLNTQRSTLRSKRNSLLKKLSQKGFIPADDLDIYLDEELPQKLKNLPQLAYHALTYLKKLHPEQNYFVSTIHPPLQEKLHQLILDEMPTLQNKGINNAAALILDNQTNQVLAYMGNVYTIDNQFSYVDIVQSPRSYGSLLKPLLYVFAIEKGGLLPYQLIPDIPIHYDEWAPQNFDKLFRGAVPMNDFVTQSLNVPAVKVLNTVGYERFYQWLSQMDINDLKKGAHHYGLSLILGGGEASLWDLTRVYKGLSRNYNVLPHPYATPILATNVKVEDSHRLLDFSIGSHSLQYTIQAMADLTKPREEKYRDHFSYDAQVAWKTGTSFGHRDAWTVGFNKKYTIGVWVGNENGMSSQGLTGIYAAAPLFFKILNSLPNNTWFTTPQLKSNTQNAVHICTSTGYIASPTCPQRSSITMDNENIEWQQCPYHIKVDIDSMGRRITPYCTEYKAKSDTCFVLPPILEYYYVPSHPEYDGLPNMHTSCHMPSENLKIIYPEENLKVFLPREKQENTNPMVVRAYHKEEKIKIFWFLNDVFIKESYSNDHNHTFGYTLKAGSHTLSAIDMYGEKKEVRILVLDK